MKEKYIIRYFLSASHFVIVDGEKSMIHPHSWHIETEVSIKGSSMVNYRVLDKRIELILESLDGKIINNEEEFKGIDCTTENLGKVLFKKISKELESMEYSLDKLSISENASRTFILERD
ncbi:MAG: 6-carboxytetrahydropterin synthase [Clostridium sp.]